MNNVMAGKLIVFKGDDEIVGADTLVEVTELYKSGFVEIAFDDRGERVYVRFPLPQLLALIAKESGSDEV